jgi:hypothetical protein
MEALGVLADEWSLDVLADLLDGNGRRYLFSEMTRLSALKPVLALQKVVLDARKYFAKYELGITKKSQNKGLKNLCEVLQTQGWARRDMPEIMGVVKLYGCAFEEWPEVGVYFDHLKNIDAWTNRDYERLPGSELADEIREALTQRMDATTVDSIITGFSKNTKPTRRQVQMLQEACGVLPPIFADPQISAIVRILGKQLCDLRLQSAKEEGDCSQDMLRIEAELSRYAEHPFTAALDARLYLGRDNSRNLGELPAYLSLDASTFNALNRARITTIQELIDQEEQDPGLGELLLTASLFEIPQQREALNLLQRLGH